MKRHSLLVAHDREQVIRYVEAGRHLKRDGSCRTLAEMAHALDMPPRTVMRHINANPKIAAKVAGSRTDARGGRRSRSDPWDF